jgi:hypothetical protein
MSNFNWSDEDIKTAWQLAIEQPRNKLSTFRDLMGNATITETMMALERVIPNWLKDTE